MSHKLPTLEKFWNKVEKKGPDDCWLWNGCKNKPNGYGRFWIDHRVIFSATRFSYLLHIGEIPNKMLVCHKCNTPSCVNPNHLYLGTHKENMQDASKAGLMKNWHCDRSKLQVTEAQVRIIRTMPFEIIRQADVARLLGCRPNVISRIAVRTTWKHVD